MAKTGKIITNQPPEMHIKSLQLTHYHLLTINNIFTLTAIHQRLLKLISVLNSHAVIIANLVHNCWAFHTFAVAAQNRRNTVRAGICTHDVIETDQHD